VHRLCEDIEAISMRRQMQLYLAEDLVPPVLPRSFPRLRPERWAGSSHISESRGLRKTDMNETVYTSCVCNCGGNSQCVLKVHLKDGVVDRVEPDDRYNPNVGMEDKAISERPDEVRLQQDPASWLAFHKHCTRRTEILSP